MTWINQKWLLTVSFFMMSFGFCQSQIYEVYDQQFNLVQKINNDHIYLLGESIRVSDKDQKLKLLNNSYEPFLELEGAEIYQYLSPWIIVSDNKKFGAYHEYGEQILKPEYDHIDSHYHQLLANKQNTYFHYDIGTKTLQSIGNFQEAYFAKNGQVIAKNPSGYLLPLSNTPNKPHHYLSSVSEGTILSHEPTGYGLINRHGEYILDPILDSLTYLEEEYFYGYKDNQYMLIRATDKDAEIRYSSYHKIALQEDVILEYIHGKLRRVMKNDGILLDILGMKTVVRTDKDHYNVYFKNGKVGLLDRTGVWQVVPTENIASILPGREELYGAYADQKYGFVNRGGKLIIPFQFENVQKFSEGLAGIQTGGLWGYVDSNGTISIAPQFDEVGEFHQGLAIVKKEGKANLINKAGTLLLPEYYHHISLSDDHYYITEDKGLYGLIDPMGTEICNPTFQSIRREGHDRIIVERNNRFGIIKESGDLVLPIYYMDIFVDPATQKILAEDIYTPPAPVDEKKKKKRK